MNPNRDLLRQIEHRLENAIEGFFGSMFRSRLQPAEIARRLAREMEANKLVGPRTVTVPGHYTVYIPPDDLREVEPALPIIVPELEQYLAEAAGDRGLRIVGALKVSLQEDASLRPGTMRIQAQIAPPEAEPSLPSPEQAKRPHGPGPRAVRRRLAIRHAGGAEEELELTGSEQQVGRADDAHIRLQEQPVSRYHARLVWDGEHTIIEDQGSTNGTFVNGRRITSCLLKSGDVIRIGASVLEYRVVHSV